MAKLITYLLYITILFSFIFLTMSKETEYNPESNSMELEVSNHTNVEGNARGGAATPSTISHACFSAKSVVLNVFVSLQALTATNKCVLVTTTGRLNKVDQNVLEENERTPTYLVPL
ncbi:hypothetical protein F2Q69_00020733 [Brassica cretica]|uniref:Transmembrane protein n=3 Tax=Brassica TaxID=3705 RepID=A0A0D3AQJ4_BRAOL|nr:hypothetical protein F2Q69_00020733 [Brassica cretica]VDD23074.1 unnamed protein product [Brassica oleracea]